MSNQNEKKDPEPSVRGQSLWQVAGSVLASMFGVQSSKKHEQDFAKGRPWVYIVMGLVATIAFILTVWFLVQMALKAAGA